MPGTFRRSANGLSDFEEGPTLFTPELQYEGADCPIEPSERDSVHHRVHQLRDPCIFEDMGKTYLLYSVAGEREIAIGGLTKS